MKHLTDEQFEDVLQGTVPEPAHIGQCQICRDILTEKRALRTRLQSAFASVQPGRALAENVRGQLTDRSESASAVPAELSVPFIKRVHLRRRLWPTLAAAAAILVVAGPLVVYFTSPPAAQAAQAELVKMHEHNLSPHREFYTDADPENLATYLKTQLGFAPAFPRLGRGMSLRGCCLAHFRQEIVGSYVVDTPRGIMSIIVVPDRPQTLGMSQKLRRAGRTFWAGSYANCHMVTVRLGKYSYCAVGEISIPHNMLTDLLTRLVPPASR